MSLTLDAGYQTDDDEQETRESVRCSSDCIIKYDKDDEDDGDDAAPLRLLATWESETDRRETISQTDRGC